MSNKQQMFGSHLDSQQVAVPSELTAWAQTKECAQVVESVREKSGVVGIKYERARPGKALFIITDPSVDARRAARCLLELHLDYKVQFRIAEQRRIQTQKELDQTVNEFELGNRVEFAVPKDVLGLVIGKGGANISRVKEITGVDRILVDRNSNVVRIKGDDPLAVRRARDMLEFTEETVVLASHSSNVLGDRVNGIIGIQRKTGLISLRTLPKNSNDAPDTTILSLVGTKSAVALAKEMIDMRMEYEEKLMVTKEEEQVAMQKLAHIDNSFGLGGPSTQSGRGDYRNHQEHQRTPNHFGLGRDKPHGRPHQQQQQYSQQSYQQRMPNKSGFSKPNQHQQQRSNKSSVAAAAPAPAPAGRAKTGNTSSNSKAAPKKTTPIASKPIANSARVAQRPASPPVAAAAAASSVQTKKEQAPTQTKTTYYDAKGLRMPHKSNVQAQPQQQQQQQQRGRKQSPQGQQSKNNQQQQSDGKSIDNVPATARGGNKNNRKSQSQQQPQPQQEQQQQGQASGQTPRESSGQSARQPPPARQQKKNNGNNNNDNNNNSIKNNNNNIKGSSMRVEASAGVAGESAATTIATPKNARNNNHNNNNKAQAGVVDGTAKPATKAKRGKNRNNKRGGGAGGKGNTNAVSGGAASAPTTTTAAQAPAETQKQQQQNPAKSASPKKNKSEYSKGPVTATNQKAAMASVKKQGVDTSRVGVAAVTLPSTSTTPPSA